MTELVVLVDDHNNPIGTADKSTVHSQKTPLHRGISVFLFNGHKQLLIQQRSRKKKTWPLVWSNSCCGHPGPNETNMDTAARRLEYELGVSKSSLSVILPDYQYQHVKNGISENEICCVLTAVTDQEPIINTDEVETVKWIPWKNWLNEIKNNPKKYSEWSIEETGLLIKNPEFMKFIQL